MNETRLKPHNSHSPHKSSTAALSRKSALQRAIFASAAFALCHSGAHSKGAAKSVSHKNSHAKPAKERDLTGVWGWTSGTQTYLRARPGAQTPPVAKVPAHTKMYIWGTFDGWYRVETTDHIFGWVHSSYLNAPGAEKLRELSHRKAKLASDRTANQTMYGSKELLSRHYAQYGAPGAAKGLLKHGVRLTARAESKSSKSSPRIAATTPRVRTISTRIARRDDRRAETSLSHSDASLNDVGNVRIAPLQNTTIRYAGKANANSDATKNASRLAAIAKSDAARAAARDQQTRDSAAKARLNAANARRIAAAQRLAQQAQTEREAKQRLALAQQAQQKAQDQKQAQQQRWTQAQAARKASQQASAQRSAARVAARKAAENKRAQSRLWAYRQAQARRTARAEARRQRLAWKREQIRTRMGSNVTMSPPPATLPGLRPLSPEELLRARAEYLTQKNGSSDPTISQSPEGATLTPSSFTAPSFAPSFAPAFSQSGFMQAGFNPAARGTAVLIPAVKAPDTFSDEWVSPLPGAKATVSSQSIPAVLQSRKNAPGSRKASRKVIVKVAAKFKAKTPTKTAMKAPSRGGSMRDYAIHAARRQNAFGDAMASQAMSYRGMPYISGSASPRRGFDCSGLVYFLLRQRGVNSPRTAAGMASLGQSVGKGSLQRGDVVLFANTYKRGISHVGVYMGDGKFVHAANSRAGVRVDSLFGGYYGKKYWGARRVK